MKNIEISKSVMKNIATMEKRRIASYRRTLFILFGGFILLLLGSIVGIWYTLVEQQTFDLFSLFSEDREIIAEFWQDTIFSVVQQLPQQELAIGGIVVCVILVLVVCTRKKRRIVTNKEKEISRYL